MKTSHLAKLVTVVLVICLVNLFPTTNEVMADNINAASIRQPLSIIVDGDLDITFNGTGKVTTDFGSGNDYGHSVALQSDGKIVVAGQTNNGIYADFALARYNPDGSLDTSFGSGGTVTTDFSGNQDIATSVALQPADSKIVVVGQAKIGSQPYFALARYNPNGSLDTSFGSGGKVTTAFGGVNVMASSVALQPDGKIVVAGTGNNDFSLARYNPDGNLDPSFGSGGTVSINFGPGGDLGYSLVLQPDGKLVMAGIAHWYTGNRDLGLARFNPNGSLDISFGSGGKFTTDLFGNDDFCNEVALQTDGKIVAACTVRLNNNYDFALARYTPDGSLDTSFGSSGKVATDLGGSGYDDAAYTLALQPDGKIVATGYSNYGSQHDLALARYNPDGSLDTSFSDDGKVTTDFFGYADVGIGIALQPDGRIVVTGSTYTGGNYDIAVARYESGDTEAPTILCTVPDQSLWYGDDVTVSCTASDSGSGLANPDDASFTLSTSVADGTETASADTDSRSVCDNAGNCAMAGPYTFMVDKKSPVITIIAPTPATYILNQTVVADYTCWDGGSGMAACAGPVASGSNLDTSSVGSKTFTVSATDGVGNSSSASVSYGVVYNFTGFFSPVDSLPVLNVANAGQTIPLKWRLTDANGTPVTDLASATVTVVSLDCDLGTTPDQIEEYGAGGSGLQNLGDGYYQFNWKTPKSYAKSCKTMHLNLGEGPGLDHVASFKFVK